MAEIQHLLQIEKKKTNKTHTKKKNKQTKKTLSWCCSFRVRMKPLIFGHQLNLKPKSTAIAQRKVFFEGRTLLVAPPFFCQPLGYFDSLTIAMTYVAISVHTSHKNHGGRKEISTACKKTQKGGTSLLFHQEGKSLPGGEFSSHPLLV